MESYRGINFNYNNIIIANEDEDLAPFSSPESGTSKCSRACRNRELQ